MQHQTDIVGAPTHPQFLVIGQPARRIAYLKRAACGSRKPGLIWLGGFMSTMRSTKATFVDQYAAREKRACLLFDYSGHGESDGLFEDGTIGAWLEESLAFIRSQSSGPQILIGSSMGGWLALLCADELAKSGESGRLGGLILLAPAVDMTERLIFDQLSPENRRELETKGQFFLPSDYSASPYPITRNLIEEGRRHLILNGAIRTHCPVRILQGMQDRDVPWQHAMTLVEHLAADPVVLTLVKDGDHRLSRPSDLVLLAQAIEAVVDSPV